MAFDPNLVSLLQADALLPTPLYVGLSDANAATAIDTPVLTPVKTPITASTLAAAWDSSDPTVPSVSGPFLLTLQAAVLAGVQAMGVSPPTSQSQQATALGSSAIRALSALNGSGIDATNPVSQAGAAAFVAAELATQAQVNAVFYSTSYVCGNGTYAAADVTAARAELTRQATLKSMRTVATSAQAYYVNEIINPALAGTTDPSTLPTFQTYVAGLNS